MNKSIRSLPTVWDEFVERRSDGAVLKIVPFITIYNIRFKDDVVYFKHESDKDWYKTNITKTGIQQYYAMIIKCIKEHKMPPRMVNVDLFGNDLSWSSYDPQYNKLSHLHEAFDRQEIGYQEFIDKALEEGININNVTEE
jgi:hypothetical protein